MDIDEYARFDELCVEREICINTIGSYDCECVDGLLPTESGCQPRAVHIAAGEYFGCIIVEGGDLYCWGSSNRGALGIGSAYAPDAPPTRVEGDQSWRLVETGFEHTCVITTDNDLYCWRLLTAEELGRAFVLLT